MSAASAKMSAADAIRKQIAELKNQLAGLEMALSAVEGVSAPATAKAASTPAVHSGKISVRKPHPTKRPVREAAGPISEVSDEAWEEWASAVVAYINASAARYPEGIPMANVTNPGLYKNGVVFVAFPGVKGGVEQALTENGFEIIVNEETGGKMVKNRAA